MKVSKKRKYSRGGCNECRRRKMKCDETKPYCYNCSRLNKECMYRPKFQFKDIAKEFDSKQTNVKENTGDVVFQRDKNISLKKLSIKSSNQNGNTRGKTQGRKEDTSLIWKEKLGKESPLVNSVTSSNDSPLGSYNLTMLLPMEKMEHENVVNQDNFSEEKIVAAMDQEFDITDMDMILDEANLLVTGINDITMYNYSLEDGIKNIADSVSDIQRSHSVSVLSQDADREEFRSQEHGFNIGLNTLSAHSFLGSKNSNYARLHEVNKFLRQETRDASDHPTFLKNSELAEIVADSVMLNEAERNDLNAFVLLNLSYSIYPFASSIESNQATILLLSYLKKCHYLVFSLLAFSATLQQNILCRDNQKKSQEYVTKCLKFLSKAFADSKWDNAQEQPKNIERLLLTVLVLTSNFASVSYSNENQILNSWKYHLKGAKDLLLKFSRALSNRKEKPTTYMSPGLALAKTWFFAIEGIASIFTPLGGTLNGTTKKRLTNNVDGLVAHDNTAIFAETGFFDRENNPEYHDTLLTEGFLYSDQKSVDFNLFLGYTKELVFAIEKISNALNHLRVYGPTQLSNQALGDIMTSLHSAKGVRIIPKINEETFEIHKDSIAHPNYDGPELSRLSPETYCKISKQGEDSYFSWLDFSHQIHVDSLYLRVYNTSGLMKLPRSHSLIQQILKGMLRYMFFLRSKSSPDFVDHRYDILAETGRFYVLKDEFDTRCMMAHSAYVMCIPLVQDEVDFEKLELYFLGIACLGTGSALRSLKNLKESKKKSKNYHNAYQRLMEYDDCVLQDMDIPFC